MSRFSNTWSLMKSSFSVLKDDKAILIFPVLSGLFTILIAGTFIFPLLFTEFISAPGFLEEASSYALYFFGFCFYFVTYFIVIFFNSAAVIYAIDVMIGGNPSVGGAFNKVMSRISAIMGWTFIAATVGLILNTIENQSDTIGRIVMSFLGLSWTVISFLVLPILVIEGMGPIDSLKASAKMLKQSWGEQLIGHFSFGLLFALLVIPIMLIFVLLVSQKGVLAFTGVVFLVISLLVLGIVQWALQSIFMGAVYLYVRDHKVPGTFSLSQIDNAMK